MQAAADEDPWASGHDGAISRVGAELGGTVLVRDDVDPAERRLNAHEAQLAAHAREEARREAAETAGAPAPAEGSGRAAVKAAAAQAKIKAEAAEAEARTKGKRS